MTRKVILTGLMIYWAPGTVQQLLIGSTISAVYMVRIDAYAVAQERPQVEPSESLFKRQPCNDGGSWCVPQGVAILKQPYLTPFNNRECRGSVRLCPMKHTAHGGSSKLLGC
jgi:hypothetical protein